MDCRQHLPMDAENVAENCAISALRSFRPMTNDASLLRLESNDRLEVKNDYDLKMCSSRMEEKVLRLKVGALIRRFTEMPTVETMAHAKQCKTLE